MQTRLGIYTALVALVLSGCSSPAAPAHLADAPTPTPTPTPAPAAGDVTLLDGNAPLDPSALVFSAGTILNPAYKDATGAPATFVTDVIKIAEAKYVGYLLPVAKDAAGDYAAAGPLQGFTARYATAVTAYWESSAVTPDSPNFNTNDIKAVAASPQLVKVQGAASDNLRLYISTVRTGYQNGAYTFQPGLLLFYVAPADGQRTSFLYTSVGGRAQLFRTPSAALPATRDAASLINVITAADTLVAIHAGSPVRYQIPFHSYVSESFRVISGQSERGTPTPLGAPVALSDAAAATVAAAWAEIGSTNGTLAADSYAALLAVAKGSLND